MTTKQRQCFWEAGNSDEYVNEVLSEVANECIDQSIAQGIIAENDRQQAIACYVDGFLGHPL